MSPKVRVLRDKTRRVPPRGCGAKAFTATDPDKDELLETSFVLKGRRREKFDFRYLILRALTHVGVVSIRVSRGLGLLKF